MQTEDIVIADTYEGVTTERIIVGMLTENTGRGICDSGDAYGRNWQRNQGKDFAALPTITGRWYVNTFNGKTSADPGFDISLYHWMAKFLEFDPEMQMRLDAFCVAEDVWNLEAAEVFAAHLNDTGELEDAPQVTNTYNDTDYWNLSQILQFTAIAVGEGSAGYEPTHLIISVHGGCDVRGGYSDPKVFKLNDEFTTAMDGARLDSIYTSTEGWYASDTGWRYVERRDDNESEAQSPFDLPTFKVEDIGPLSAAAWDELERFKALRKESSDGWLRTTEPPVNLVEACEGQRQILLDTAHHELTQLHDEALFGLDGFLYLSMGSQDSPQTVSVGNCYF